MFTLLKEPGKSFWQIIFQALSNLLTWSEQIEDLSIIVLRFNCFHATFVMFSSGQVRLKQLVSVLLLLTGRNLSKVWHQYVCNKRFCSKLCCFSYLLFLREAALNTCIGWDYGGGTKSHPRNTDPLFLVVILNTPPKCAHIGGVAPF